jgi:hypothetical protein
MATIDHIVAVSHSIRFVALYRGGELTSRQGEDMPNASASESDRLEQLFVNPTLLTLARHAEMSIAAGRASSWSVTASSNSSSLICPTATRRSALRLAQIRSTLSML